MMKLKPVYTKMTAAVMLLLTVNLSFGSFTGTTLDEHSSNKFGLKNLAALSKNYSLSYLKTGSLRFVGNQEVSQQKVNDTVEVQSMMRIQRGNTTFVYPYKYKVQVPRFKTPSPPSFPMNTH
jgi:hypothetical protein